MKKFRCLVISSVIFFLFFSSYHSYAQGDTIHFGGSIYARISDAVTRDQVGRADSFLEPHVPLKFQLKEMQVNIRAVRDFRKRYAQISDVIWTGSSEGFNARFVEDSLFTTVYYSPSGRWKHVIKRYREAQLLKSVRARVKSVYYDFSIMLVYEIQWHLAAEPVHYVHLRWGQQYKVVAVGSELTEIQSFQLQKK
jgi:hypothetical protein